MSGSCVNQARARLRGDVVATKNYGRLDTGDGMQVLKPVQEASCQLGLNSQANAERLLQRLHEAICDDEAACPALGPRRPHDRILEGGVHGDGPVGGKRPGRGGPDRDLQACRLHKRGQGLGCLGTAEGRVDGKRLVALRVLELRLGKCRPRRGRPVHGPPPTIDVPAPHHFLKDSHLRGFVLRQQRQVWLLKVTPDTIPLEGLSLLRNSLAGEFSRGLPELQRR
mmetsp:Transcript_87248/g.282490  ORF Transcript_87248/g.282490 Transcript_87248/m.282490 type:complete len:225 (-) Transcript_87248:301-975(-)